MAPRARFELATLRLTAECSTVELPGIRAGRIARHCFQSSEPSEECQRGQALRAERPSAGLARFSTLSRQPRMASLFHLKTLRALHAILKIPSVSQIKNVTKTECIALT